MTTERTAPNTKRLATLYEGVNTPALVNNPSAPFPLWLDTSGLVPVLKMANKDHSAWIPVAASESDGLALAAVGDLTTLTTTVKTDAVSAINEVDANATAANDSLTAIDTAMVALVAVAADLDDTLIDTDVDTPAELAPILVATNTKVNALATLVGDILVALKAIRSE